jgi:hypothetical protein
LDEHPDSGRYERRRRKNGLDRLMATGEEQAQSRDEEKQRRIKPGGGEATRPQR